jgi:hypothetical protein
MITHVSGQPTNLVFKFKNTAPANLLRKMEQNAATVFNEIDNASRENRLPRFSTVNMTNDGITKTLAIWASSSFHCIEPAYNENVSISIRNQFAVRNIAVYFKEQSDESKRSQDLSVEFDKTTGQISNMTIEMEKIQYDKIMKTGNVVSDLRYKEFILEFVEEYRTAYNRQDIDLIEKMFNDQALIITGMKVTTLVDGKYVTKAAYKEQNKKQYIEKLKNVTMAQVNGKFQNKITVNFDKIEVIKSANEEKIYLVRLWQKWDSKGRINYSDEGWLSLVIDFNDEENPTIWVRAWNLPDTPVSQRYSFECFYAPDVCK